MTIARDGKWEGLREHARGVCSRNTKIDRPCARRLAQTVSIRSTKRDPAGLADPNDPLRHKMAFRIARSTALLVGSRPSTLARVRSAAPALTAGRHGFPVVPLDGA